MFAVIMNYVPRQCPHLDSALLRTGKCSLLILTSIHSNQYFIFEPIIKIFYEVYRFVLGLAKTTVAD